MSRENPDVFDTIPAEWDLVPKDEPIEEVVTIENSVPQEPTIQELYAGMNSGTDVGGKVEVSQKPLMAESVNIDLPHSEATEKDTILANESAVDIELPFGEVDPNKIELLKINAENVATEEKSEFEQFKADFSEGAKNAFGRIGPMFTRAGGLLKDAAWSTLYGAKRGVEFTAEIPQKLSDVAKKVSDSVERSVEYTAGLPQRAVRAFEGSDAERAVEYAAGLPQRAERAATDFVDAGIAKYEAAKDKAKQAVINVKNNTVNAVSAVGNAVKTRSRETVDFAKQELQNGISVIAEGVHAVKERAESGIKNAWEKMKEKKNALKHGLIMAKVGYHMSQGNRLSAQAKAKYDKANKVKESLAAL